MDQKTQMQAVELATTTLKSDEGYREKMYKCSRGFTTIGYGTNLDDGLDEEEAAALLQVRVNRDARRLAQVLPNVHPACFAVALNMAYQLGIDGFLAFTNTIRCMQAGAYGKAADNLLLSLFAQQTPARAKRHAAVLRSIKEG